MKIVIAASEVVPYAKTGGLADVAGALPLALRDLGHEVVIIMPHYKCVNASASVPGVKTYFIDHPGYFGRDGLYGTKAGDYPDNLKRFSYYCRAVLDLLKDKGFKPDIIHCHDWQSALIPVYLKAFYAQDDFFKKTRTLLTIHNIGFQGIFSRDEFPFTGLDWSYFNVEAFEFYGRMNVLKAGLLYCDYINTVSPTYSQEIRTEKFGFGLEGVLNERAERLSGILNGIDYAIWDPAQDRNIAKGYSLDTLADKAICKEALQKYAHLDCKKDIPLVGMVARLTQPKGFDIIAEGIDTICKLGLQLVILGTGDEQYHRLMEEKAKKYPHTVALFLRFDDDLAHKIYAGCDIYLMPSAYEPCGLGQLIALRYGSIPLVYKTGGLADTVNKDNGFVFDEYSSKALIKTLKKSLKAYSNAVQWNKLQKKAMQANFSWQDSAREYVRIYEKATRS